ncbi:TolB family protein [Aerococcus urinaeequi]
MKKRLKEKFQRHPAIYQLLAKTYLYGNYFLSDKKKSEGNITKLSPNDEFEYFFGYYDKSPWNSDEKFVTCLKVENSLDNVAPNKPADIVLIDMKKNKEVVTINQTNSWNLQQGSMLQWLGPNYNEEIIFNDFREGRYCSVIYNIKTQTEKILREPIYDVTENGKYALTLDFSRLHSLRPGYGYANLHEKNKDIDVPDDAAIKFLDLSNNTSKTVITYKDLFNLKTKPSMIDAKHWVNHIMINPSGDRAMFLHRWMKNSKTYTRLLTMDIDGSNLYIVNDDDMTSHSYWKNDTEILSYAHKEGYGNGYYKFFDKSEVFEPVIEELKNDGHPSYSPDGKKIITDQYPDKHRKQSLYLIDEKGITTVAKVFSPFKYKDDFRCDLHPKWDRKSNKVAFDATFEGKRGLYMISIKGDKQNEKN